MAAISAPLNSGTSARAGSMSCTAESFRLRKRVSMGRGFRADISTKRFGWRGQNDQVGEKQALIAVFADQKSGHFGLQIAVAGMNSGPQGCFGGTALTNSFQNPLQITGSVGLADVLYGSQRLVVGESGLRPGESHEISFQRIDGNLSLGMKEL